MTDADKTIEVLLLRAPLDLTLPVIVGAQRAMQGPLERIDDARFPSKPSEERHFELMAESVDQANEFVMNVPSLCGSVIATPTDAPHLTLVEAPACLNLSRAISHLAPRLMVVEVVSHILGHDRETNRFAIWQGGADIRLRENDNSVPDAPDLNEGEAQPWETPVSPLSRLTRFDLIANIQGLGVDLAEVLGRRHFQQSIGLAPLLASTISQNKTAFDAYQGLTDRAVASGFGGYACPDDLAKSRRKETQFRAVLTAIEAEFEDRLSQADDPADILALARETTDRLATHGWRAEPRIMQVLAAALAKSMATQPDHLATQTLQALHDRAARKAYILG